MFHPVVSLHSAILAHTRYNIIFNKYLSKYLEFCISVSKWPCLIDCEFGSDGIYNCVYVCVYVCRGSVSMFVCVPDSCDYDRWLTQLICVIAFKCSNESYTQLGVHDRGMCHSPLLTNHISVLAFIT